MQRTLWLRWVAKYFATKPAAPNRKRVSGSADVGLSAPPTSRRGFDLSMLAKGADVEDSRIGSRQYHVARKRDEAASQTKTVHSQPYLSNAHRSCASLLHNFVKSLPRDSEWNLDAISPSKCLDAKTSLLPALLMLLPDALPQRGTMKELLTSESLTKNRSRFVAIPSQILPLTKANQSGQPTIGAFLTSVDETLRNPSYSAPQLENGTYTLVPQGFHLRDFACMLQVAALCKIYDPVFLERISSELLRFLDARDKVMQEQQQKQREVHHSTATGTSSTATLAVPPQVLADILFFASDVGYLEDELLKRLLVDVAQQLKSRHFSTKHLVRVVIALNRFHCHQENVYEHAIRQLGARCRGSELKPEEVHSSANSSKLSIVALTPRHSVANERFRIPKAWLIELVKCVSLCAARPPDLITAIVQRLIALHEAWGTSPHEAPSAHELHFVATLLQSINHDLPEIHAMLLVAAAREKGGVIVNHGGNTSREEATTFSEFTVDFVKHNSSRRF